MLLYSLQTHTACRQTNKSPNTVQSLMVANKQCPYTAAVGTDAAAARKSTKHMYTQLPCTKKVLQLVCTMGDPVVPGTRASQHRARAAAAVAQQQYLTAPIQNIGTQGS